MYTESHRDALLEAIASGVLRVSYDGRTVEYRSLTDLRAALRAHPDDDGPVQAEVRRAIEMKPKAHDFHIGRGEAPAVARHMSTTGG